MGSLSKGDPVLQFINSNYVTLKDSDRETYMVHYQRVLKKLENLMKEKDELFNALFSRHYWAGSYYDGLKVGKPEEYDVDMIIKLPIDYSTIDVVTENVDPRFVALRAKALAPDTFHNNPRWREIYRPLDKWTDADGFLLQNKLREWIESVVTRTLNNPETLEIDGFTYTVKHKKTGPAQTFLITVPGGIQIDVDLVPVLEFSSAVKWPPSPFRGGPRGKSWFAVPKPNSENKTDFKPTYWRLGFHDQENTILNDKQQLKPVCRLLKKLRDKSLKNIASYYIKTLFLWEEEANNTWIWRGSITDAFLYMLERLQEALGSGRIDYFWDREYNLIGGISEVAIKNNRDQVARIVKSIKQKLPENPKILAEYLLTPEELAHFEGNYRPLSNDGNNIVVPESNSTDAEPVEKPPRCRLS